LTRKQLSKIALFEVKDAPKDALTEMVLSLGEDLAKDPSVQNAVYKRFGVEMPSSIEGGEEMDADTDAETSAEHLEEQLTFLKEELESQQTLNDQLIYHNDRLAEDKMRLKRDLTIREMRLRKAERDRQLLKEKLRSMGADEKEILNDNENDVQSGQVSPQGSEGSHNFLEQEGWTMSEIVVKALAVAAVVILMAVVKKKGAVTVAATAAVGAWSWMRTKMKV